MHIILLIYLYTKRGTWHLVNVLYNLRDLLFSFKMKTISAPVSSSACLPTSISYSIWNQGEFEWNLNETRLLFLLWRKIQIKADSPPQTNFIRTLPPRYSFHRSASAERHTTETQCFWVALAVEYVPF